MNRELPDVQAGFRKGRGGEGNGNPLHYSCLENPMDRGSWQVMVHGVAENWTQLKCLLAKGRKNM